MALFPFKRAVCFENAKRIFSQSFFRFSFTVASIGCDANILKSIRFTDRNKNGQDIKNVVAVAIKNPNPKYGVPSKIERYVQMPFRKTNNKVNNRASNLIS